MADTVHFLFRRRRIGEHIHVGVWAGTELQARNKGRPKLGDLVMDPEQWHALSALLEDGDWAQRTGDRHTVTIEEADRDG